MGITQSAQQPLDLARDKVKAAAGKYLTFHLAAEEYGVEILKVREIIGLMKITRIPQSPHYIRGVINLRGKVIPVLDLRLRFGMETSEDTEQTCIIVVDVITDNDKLMIGVVVDAVSEVVAISQDQIEAAPSVGTHADNARILGIAKIKNEVKILLDIDQVLNLADLETSNQPTLESFAEELATA